ncbi:EAL domain-containing protein [Thiohalobacter sp. IOR34]|uniref:putative bifunctional diguanylate cyclase/phosphodiesterase n=1 Tax=Thiohalobacter sp. IOR34 TaxID=3057176 RepID=UPI0025AFF469|nr:EAL domain-containing protein [Thiohalobacter sp. IOR34]WJW75589.1 EAL domain-containing protein [Thiohalobacter sp. IOR34]
MKIGQKNTLFVLMLVSAVLVGMALSGYYLVQRHVAAQIDADIARAHRVFVEAERSAFTRLQAAAHGIAREPSLLAAALTADTATVRGMLEDLYPRPGIELLAVYLGGSVGSAVAEASKPHLSSSQVLASAPMLELIQRVGRGEPVAYGNALIFDTFLQLAAIPLRSPLGGSLGVLVVGEELDQSAVEQLKQLIRAEVAVFSGNVVLGSTLPIEGDLLQQMEYGPGPRQPLRFSAGDEVYLGHVYRLLAGDGSTTVARLLVAQSSDSYWAPYRQLGLQGLMFSAGVLLLASLLGIGISQVTLTRPIMLLSKATRQISSGNLDHKVVIERDDELGELARSFNAMLEDLGRSRAELVQSHRRFHDFAESSSDWLWETDAEGRLVYVSSGVVHNLGVAVDSLLGHSFAEVFPRDDLGELTDRLCPPGRRHFPFKDLECRVTLPDGSRRTLRLNGLPVVEGGQFRGYRGTASDVSKARQAEERLAVLSSQDQLTGLANRRRFLVDLAHEIRRAQSRDSRGVLMLLDLDYLKMINDTAGHAVGDEILIQVAGVLTRLSRSEDLVARVSGDEFALAFPDMSLEEARAKAEMIRQGIAECRPVHGGSAINVSASIGVVSFPDRASNAVELMALADTAMYTAKDNGRDQVRLFSELDRQREHMGSLLAARNQVLEALEEERFELVFQPIADVLSGGVHHFETLLRIRNPDGTLLMPGNFIPAAEQFGLIGRIDRLVLHEALARLAALPPEMASVGLSLNLSGLSVGDEGMLRLICEEVEASGVAPERITFEVTETAACENMGRAVEFIARIRQLGCKISLDDFGVGFSSFSYLKNLRVDVLKIDGSFIRDITRSQEDQLFVKALVDVARGMGIHTVAEFVETREALLLLRRIGVDYVQGYYIGRPGPTMELRQIEIPSASAVRPALVG